MTDPNEEIDRFRAEMDQSIEAMTELSRALWRFFSDLEQQGFTEARAFALTMEWMRSTIRGSTGPDE